MVTAAELIARRRAARRGRRPAASEPEAPEGEKTNGVAQAQTDEGRADQSPESEPKAPEGEKTNGTGSDDADSRLDRAPHVERGDDGGETQRLG